jgi:C4-dicarboxylate-specific signal transduction histidine kinase
VNKVKRGFVGANSLNEMIISSERAEGTVFFVPNTSEGQEFIAQLRKYLNDAVYKLDVRGRNPYRRKVARSFGLSIRAMHYRVPHHYATYFAVYLNRPKVEQRQRAENTEHTLVAREVYERLKDAGHAAEFRQQRIAALEKEMEELRNPKLPENLVTMFGREIVLEGDDWES